MRPAICALVDGAELEFVEYVACDPPIRVRVPEARIVRARRRQALVPALYADGRRERGETQIEGNELRLHARFLLLIGEGLADTVARQVGVVGKAEFVVLVVRYATPEADAVDHCRRRTPFALAQQVGLMCVDASLVVFAVNTRNVIERIVLGDRESKEALIKDIRAAHRAAVTLRGGVRLPTVEVARLGRVGSLGRIGWHEIGIAWDSIILPRAAKGIGMHRKVSAARVQQCSAVDSIIDRGSSAAELGIDPAIGNVGRNAVVG